jgi:predicted nucleic acid-binding protein
MTLARSLKQPLSVTVLNVFEFENALRLAQFRGRNTPEDIRDSLESFSADCREGRARLVAIDLGSVVDEARRISRDRTVREGNRAFDILMISAALTLQATDFWSFDARQRRLAEAEGLKVNT